MDESKMTRDDIIKLALDAGFCHDINNGIYLCAPMHIERFANLVAAAERDRIAEEAKHIIKRAEARGAAAEREACAKVCDERADADGWDGYYANQCAAVIRARG